MLKIVGSLSGLFSESDEPYVAYRMAENLFCKAFGAKNLSRTDCSADASKDGLGIGIKTFLEKNGATMQKVAEFNSEHDLFRNLDLVKKVEKICDLRNKRLDTTRRIFSMQDMIYHCVTRKKASIMVYELPMENVDVKRIKSIKASGNTIYFEDRKNEYSFNITKSTLYKRFNTQSVIFDIPVTILQDPFDALQGMYKEMAKEISFAPIRDQAHVSLPLYSIKSGRKIVPEKSGLNQWNASGRSRDANEAYVPIPAWIHSEYKGFFPDRDKPFSLILPDGNKMSAKVCQDNSKALMSNPNSALGQWLLRKVLNLEERELLTYEKLEEIGLDSVVIYKAKSGEYDIDFTKVGSYEIFKKEAIPSDEDEN